MQILSDLHLLDFVADFWNGYRICKRRESDREWEREREREGEREEERLILEDRDTTSFTSLLLYLSTSLLLYCSTSFFLSFSPYLLIYSSSSSLLIYFSYTAFCTSVLLYFSNSLLTSQWFYPLRGGVKKSGPFGWCPPQSGLPPPPPVLVKVPQLTGKKVPLFVSASIRCRSLQNVVLWPQLGGGGWGGVGHFVVGTTQKYHFYWRRP